MLKELDPGCGAPTELNPELPPATIGAPPPYRTEYDTGKLEGLGASFRDMRSTIEDTVVSLKAHGFYTTK